MTERNQEILDYIRSIPREDRSEYMDRVMQSCLVHVYEKKRETTIDNNDCPTKLDTKSKCSNNEYTGRDGHEQT